MPPDFWDETGRDETGRDETGRDDTAETGSESTGAGGVDGRSPPDPVEGPVERSGSGLRTASEAGDRDSVVAEERPDTALTLVQALFPGRIVSVEPLSESGVPDDPADEIEVGRDP